MFSGRNLLIATMHKKEQAIAPFLEQELGVKCFVTKDFDTDALGTFSGEIARKDDPIVTARKKCALAMQQTNCDLAIASEGSFGPHPTISFVAADQEFLVLIDKKNKLEIIAHELSVETNFSSSEIRNIKELRDFAKRVQFPSHGLIMKRSKNNFSTIKKGITDWNTLEESYANFSENQEYIIVETDMRAMYNPTRMKVIEAAVVKLVEKIKSCCPACNTPGYGVKQVKQGLPCLQCNFPTRAILSFEYICESCNYNEIKKFPNGKEFEEPMYCDFCNP